MTDGRPSMAWLPPRLRAVARQVRRRLEPRGPAILMYHRIAVAPGDPWELCVSPENFASQLQVLKRRREVLPLSEFAARHAAGTLPRNALAITFDDGYACNAEVAVPLLAEAGLPAAIFLCTGSIGSRQWFWWDALEAIVMTSSADTLSLGDGSSPIQLGPPDPPEARRRWRVFLKSRSRRQLAYLSLWPRLRLMEEAERHAIFRQLHAQSRVPEEVPSTARAMTVDEVRALADNPLIEFGAHTVTHRPLGELSLEVQHNEIVSSKVAVEEMIGRPVASFSYPYGSLTADTVRLVTEAGLQQACTTSDAPLRRSRDIYRLPRQHVKNWTGDVLVRKLRL